MNATAYINFGTALVTFVLGLLLLTGMIFPGELDSAKTMFGVVLMIYGVYRFVNSISKIKQEKLRQRRLKIIEEKEKLLKRL